MAAYEVLLLNTAIPQIQAAQSGDTYVVPRDIAFSAALTLSAGTANGVPYLNGSKVVTTGSALTFDGTNFNVAGSGQVTGISPKTIVFYNTGAGDGLIRAADDVSTVNVLGLSKTEIKFYTSNSQAMTLDASGNLGIGTTSPINNSGYGGLSLNGTSGALFSLMTNGTESSRIASLGDETSVQCKATTGYITFVQGVTGGTEKARITSGGNLLVGTDNSAGNAGVGAKLLSTGRIFSVVSTNDGTESYSLYSTGAAAYRFYVTDTGTVYATNTTISAISDHRFKENIRDLDVGLDAILALKPRKFDWKVGKGKNKKDDRGFIAQEFEQVFPDLIDNWKDPAPEGEEPYKSVRQDLIPVLVKAIQEQQAMINELKAEVAALKGA